MNRILVAALFFCVIQPRVIFASANGDLEKGNRLFEAKRYAEALESYEKVLPKRPGSGIVNFNIGGAHYKKGSYTSAIAAFNKAIASGEAKITAPADYNIGNTKYRIGASKEGSNIKSAKEFYEIALEYYKRSMDLNPADRDAKFNYEYVSARLKLLDETKETKEEKRQEEKDKNKNKDKDKKEDKKEGSGDKGQEKEDRSEGQEAGDKGQGKENKTKEAQGSESETQSGNKEENKREETKQGAESEEKKAEEAQPSGKDQIPASPGTSETGSKGQGEREAASDEKEGQQGLEFYQAPQEPREMSPDEAKMLLEGYKGEEATGKAVRLRRKPINMEEPLKDW